MVAVIRESAKTRPTPGVSVIRCRPAGTRQVLAVRLEPELREAVDREAAKRGVSRSVLVRDALTGVVDQDVLEETARRERFEASRRGIKADEDQLRAMLSQNDQEGGSEPRWLKGLATSESATPQQALGDDLAASLFQTPAASSS